MPTYEFICKECGEVIEIIKPASESYVPDHCGKKTKRVYTPINTVAGSLNRNNVPND